MNQNEGKSKNLENLPITISIEIDRKEMLLEEIQKMNVGSVTVFSNAIPQKVKLLANGQPFANATLILIDEEVAVRLDEILN